MHIDLSADERAVISAQAGDVHADVAADGTVLSWSGGLLPRPFAFHPGCRFPWVFCSPRPPWPGAVFCIRPF